MIHLAAPPAHLAAIPWASASSAFAVPPRAQRRPHDPSYVARPEEILHDEPLAAVAEYFRVRMTAGGQ
jgi:hypothetical protein